MVNKARLAEKIAELVNAAAKDHRHRRRQGRVERAGAACGWSSILAANANPHVVLNQLYKHTQLQDTFGVNMLALVDGVPRTLNLKQVLQHYILTR